MALTLPTLGGGVPGQLPMVLFFLSALALKLGFIPYHTWLFFFYQHMSAQGLVTYLLGYYLLSLYALLSCALAFLQQYVELGYGVWCALLALLLLARPWRAGEALSLPGFIALSSCLNIALL